MLVFTAENVRDGWAPRIVTECPKCGHKVGFFSNVRGNDCKVCNHVFDAGKAGNVAYVAKSIWGRRNYHVLDTAT